MSCDVHRPLSRPRTFCSKQPNTGREDNRREFLAGIFYAGTRQGNRRCGSGGLPAVHFPQQHRQIFSIFRHHNGKNQKTTWKKRAGGAADPLSHLVYPSRRNTYIPLSATKPKPTQKKFAGERPERLRSRDSHTTEKKQNLHQFGTYHTYVARLDSSSFFLPMESVLTCPC